MHSPVDPASVKLNASDVRAPLVIGVTGHRDLRSEDVPALEERVRGILRDLKAKYSSTPLILLSALAEGADQLAARVALEQEFQEYVRLIVPLPMAQSDYIDGFEHEKSREEFNTLLARAERSFELPWPEGTPPSLPQADLRDIQYRNLAAFIARESQLLIALWDGVDSRLKGGTAQVIQFQTEGVPRDSPNDLEPEEGFPVYHIVTPRLGNPAPKAPPFTVIQRYREAYRGDHKRAAEYYAEMFGRLDAFNERLAADDPALANEARGSLDAVLPDTALGTPDPQDGSVTSSDGRTVTLSREQQETRRRYAFADALALRARRQTVLAQRLLHLLVYAAFVCFILFAHLPDGHHPEWLVMALVSLGLAGICYYRARTSNVDTRYQDYRAIAEGLRVSLFWKLVDVKDDVAAYYLRKQRTELDWIRDALRSWHVAGPRSPEHAQASNAGLAPLDSVKVAATHWVKSQKSYFEAAAEANHDRAERYELLANVAVGITVSLVVLLTIALFVPASEEYLHHHPSVTAYWIIAIDVILAAGALLHHYNERMAFSEISKQYARMEHIFEHVGRHLAAASDAKDIEAARAWLRALGTEALAENGDWVLLHRERPLLLPHP